MDSRRCYLAPISRREVLLAGLSSLVLKDHSRRGERHSAGTFSGFPRRLKKARSTGRTTAHNKPQPGTGSSVNSDT